MTDFRAMCAELVEAIEPYLMSRHLNAAARIRTADRLNSVLHRARAALAEQSVGPTRKEAVDLYSEVMATHDCKTLGEMTEHFARAVLARWDNLAAEPDSSRLHGAD